MVIPQRSRIFDLGSVVQEFNESLTTFVIGSNFEYYIHEDFRRRLNKRIYTWYIDGDFLLLKFMCHRGAFRKDINEKCLLCETEDNGIEHVINNCKKL